MNREREREREHLDQQKDTVQKPRWIEATANLSIQYNLCVISPALLLFDPSRVTNSTENSFYPRSDETDSLLKCSVFVGAIVGQCTMGLIGDLMGSLELAMIITNILALTGTIGCAIAPLLGATNPNNVYRILAVSRAVLGIGIGGKYPLASAMRANATEDQTQDSHDIQADTRAQEVARSFFWQTPGAILPYVCATILIWLFGEPKKGHLRQMQFQYMLLVGIGAIPSLLVILGIARNLQQQKQHSIALQEQGMDDETANTSEYRTGWCRYFSRQGYQRINKSHILIAIQDKSYWKKLAGTGLSWALYDFVYYGTAFNLPEILSRVIGEGGDLLSNSWHNSLIAAMGIPGVVLAICMMKPLGGPKMLQIWGFGLIGVASVLMTISSKHGKGGSSWLHTLMAIASCSLLIFSINWGCNVSTYVLPVEIFPSTVRSTFHGWSAGMGKCGAALGSFSFTKLNSVSMAVTFTVCTACCVLGICITRYLIEDDNVEQQDYNDGIQQEDDTDSDDESERTKQPSFFAYSSLYSTGDESELTNMQGGGILPPPQIQ